MKKENILRKVKEFFKAFSGPNQSVILYVVFVMGSTVFALIISSSSVQKAFFANGFCKSERGRNHCAGIVGYGGVYRTFIAHALFHLLLAVVTSEFGIFKKWREKIHEELWSIKILVLSVSVFVCLWLPIGTVFDEIVPYFGFLCGLIFSIIQMLVLLGVIDQWLDYLVPDMEGLVQEAWTSTRFLFYHSIITILYVFSLLLLIYFFLLFSNNSSCKLNLIFLSYTLVHSILISILAFLPRVQIKHAYKGIPKALTCVLHVIFLSWLAMCSNTNMECNPYIIERMNYTYPTIDGNVILNLMVLTVILCHIVHKPTLVLGKLQKFFTCEFHVTSSKTEREQSKELRAKQLNNDEETECSENLDNYSYSNLHVFMFFLNAYTMTSVTNWSKADIIVNHGTYRRSREAMFVLMLATFVCLWLCTWILVKPVLLVFLDRFREQLFDETQKTGNIETRFGLDIVNSPKDENQTNITNEETQPSKIDGRYEVDAEESVKQIANNTDANLKMPQNLNCDIETEFEMQRKINDSFKTEREMLKTINGSFESTNYLKERQKEMLRLQDKVLRLQQKIGKLQYKVSVLQGISL